MFSVVGGSYDIVRMVPGIPELFRLIFSRTRFPGGTVFFIFLD